MELPIGFGFEGLNPDNGPSHYIKTLYVIIIQTWYGLRNSKKAWRLDILLNRKCIHVYGSRKKLSCYFILMTAYCLVPQMEN